MTINTSAELVNALRESELLEEDALREVHSALVERFPRPQELADELVRRGWLTNYQAEQLLRGNSKGLVLGQYVLLERLGEGGMGQVFKARHRLMRRTVALKVIRPEWLTNRNSIHRFHREIQAVGQLAHPNVVTAHDADCEGDTHFLVMEYVDGVDLATLVHKSGPLPVELACSCIRQAAEGLQHAHERGLVHRDIKPSNLLLAGAGEERPGSHASPAPDRQALPPVVKILDMGLARLQSLEDSAEEASSTTALTQEGAVMGTADYISPEQATNAHGVDIRADIYSLGCTFYFLLTGLPPFPGGSFMEKLFKHKMDPPRPVRARRADVPPEVAAVVATMMAKRPEDRYQTPAEVAAALAPFCPPVGLSALPAPAGAGAGTRGAASLGRVTPSPEAGGETCTAEAGALLPAPPPELSATASLERPARAQPRPSSAPDTPSVLDVARPTVAEVPPARPRRPLVLTGVVLAVLVAAGAAVPLAGLFRHPPLDDSPARPTPPGDKGAGAGKDKESAPQDGPELIGPPRVTERPPMIFGPPPPPKLRVGVLYNLDGQSSVATAAFAPDGKRVLIGSADTVWLYDLANVRPDNEPLVDAFRYPFVQKSAQRRPLAVALAPAGDRVLFGTTDAVVERGQIRPSCPIVALWDVRKADLGLVRDGRRGDVQCVALSPGGLRAVSGSSDRSICIWSLDPNDRTPPRYFTRHSDAVEAVAISADGGRALTGSKDRTVCLWNLDEGKPLNTFTGHSHWVSCVAFARDGETAISGSHDTTARVWSLAEPTRPAVVLRGHEGWVLCATLSADGRHALTGGEDATVRWWDATTGKQLACFRHEEGAIVGVAFSSDERYAVSVGKDHTIRRWQLP
jgi:serine/threonine-protein kinase